jgi:hypothetical protein
VGAPHPFTVTASDGVNQAQASFNVTVTEPVNHPPEIEAQPDETIAAGSVFERSIEASDPDVGDTVTLALLQGPEGATLTGNTLRWPSTAEDLGEQAFTLRATDDHGASSGARFTVTVLPASAPIAVDDV